MPGYDLILRFQKKLGLQKGVTNSGFSLIELLVTISLIAILTAVAIPNLREYNRTQNIDEATAQIADTLKLAQSSANSSIQCPVGEVANFWEVVFTTSNYSLIANCKTSGNKTVYTRPYSSVTTGNSVYSMTSTNCVSGEGVTVFFRPYTFSYKCDSGVETTGTLRTTIFNSSFSNDIVVESGGIIRVE